MSIMLSLFIFCIVWYRMPPLNYPQSELNMNTKEQLQKAGVEHIAIQGEAAKDDGDWDLPANPQTDVQVCGLEEGCTSCQ